MVVVQPSEIPASADALRWLRAVAPFESTGRLAIAAVGYKAGVKRWPGDALVWTALGNVRYLQQDLAGAEKAYGQALALAPEHWPARNNLVNTLMARGCVGRAWKWTDAVGNPPAEFSATWNRTLEELAGVAESRCESLGEFAR